jgi:hypothetical protein
MNKFVPLGILPPAGDSGPVVAYGTIGSCTWEITGIGSRLTLIICARDMMTIGPGPPWQTYVKRIHTLKLEQGGIGIECITFSDYTNLRHVNIPASVTHITGQMFSGCGKLRDIVVEPGNASCASVDGVLFSKDKTVLFKYPEGKVGDTYKIPEGVTRIEDDAFSSCRHLRRVTVPSGVTHIGPGAFAYCRRLRHVNIPEGVTCIGVNTFFYCINLRRVTLPGSVTEIQDCAFIRCHRIRNLVIPEGVTCIGWYPFASCINLRRVILPGSVTRTGEGLFFCCDRLRDITVGWTVPPGVGHNCFHGVSLANATLRVPAGSEALYRAAGTWEAFGTIQ